MHIWIRLSVWTGLHAEAGKPAAGSAVTLTENLRPVKPLKIRAFLRSVIAKRQQVPPKRRTVYQTARRHITEKYTVNLDIHCNEKLSNLKYQI
jgi:hypothetical protein